MRLGMDVGGFTAAEADRMRRAFGRRNGAAMVETYRRKFLAGAGERGVPEPVAEAVFGKFNPHYMFPEGHALAFAFTAYKMAWLRRYHPLEFFVALFNEQPMGFWDLDTLKQDARRLGLRVAHPDVNRSELLCTPEGEETLLLGLTFVKGVDARLGETLLRAREAGEFRDLPDLLAHSGLPREALKIWCGLAQWIASPTSLTAAPHCGRWARVTYPARVGDSWRCPWQCPMRRRVCARRTGRSGCWTSTPCWACVPRAT